jgi:hypothetical protein
MHLAPILPFASRRRSPQRSSLIRLSLPKSDAKASAGVEPALAVF